MNDSPTKTSPRKCIRCGAKSVKPRTGRGRTTRFRTMPTMPIPETLLIPACGCCKSEYLDEATAAALAPQLQEAFLIELRIRARVAIDILVHHISLSKLERLLGLSQGYLCRLRAVGSNSPELVANLAMLCQDPPTRLTELERFWALPAEEWPPPATPATRTALSPHSYYPRKSKGNTP